MRMLYLLKSRLNLIGAINIILPKEVTWYWRLDYRCSVFRHPGNLNNHNGLARVKYIDQRKSKNHLTRKLHLFSNYIS